MFSEASTQSKHQQPGDTQCRAVRIGKWEQMEEPAQGIRQLEHDIRAAAAMVKKWRVATSLLAVAREKHHSGFRENHIARFHKHKGAPRWNGRFKKHGKQAMGNSRGGRNTKLHMVAASDRDAVTFFLSSGEAGDAPQGRRLLSSLGSTTREVYLLMDRAYEGNVTRDLAVQMGYIPVVPPKSNRKNPWEYDKALYKARNQIERLFRRIKRFRRIFTPYDKLDIMFVTFIFLALIVDAL